MSNLFSTGIRPAVDAHILKLSEELRDYGDYWSASTAGDCYRLQVMRRLGVPLSPEMQENNAIRQRTFSAGHIFHEWIQRITKKADLSIVQELELQDESLMIRGHIDDLVLITEEDKREFVYENNLKIADKDRATVAPQHLILYEYKTAHSGYFNYTREKIGYYHKMQLGTYMYMLRNLAWAKLEKRGKV